VKLQSRLLSGKIINTFSVGVNCYPTKTASGCSVGLIGISYNARLKDLAMSL